MTVRSQFTSHATNSHSTYRNSAIKTENLIFTDVRSSRWFEWLKEEANLSILILVSSPTLHGIPVEVSRKIYLKFP